MNKPGIALLMVIVCLSFFLLATFIMYQSALLFPRFVQDEIKQQKNEILIDGALMYAISFCRENWHQLVKDAEKGQKQELFSVPLPDANTTADIVIELGIDQQKITTTLVQNNKKGTTRSAIMHKDLTITHV